MALVKLELLLEDETYNKLKKQYDLLVGQGATHVTFPQYIAEMIKFSAEMGDEAEKMKTHLGAGFEGLKDIESKLKDLMKSVPGMDDIFKTEDDKKDTPSPEKKVKN
ncbi:MAG: hypothetical protein LBM76_00335 [Mycoplasmataceae bacterium]|jgi:hypothetical protein|nr:hypothetical protein [Mycoplasmataceae bacterium]